MGEVVVDAAEGPSAADPDVYQGTLGMLLLITGRQVNTRIRPAFESGHLKVRHVELMAVLAQYAPTSQQYLVSALRVDPSVMVVLLNELEKDGMVRRVRDARDRRRHLVEITPSGLEAMRHAMAEIEAAEAAAFAVLDDHDKQTLRRLLSAVQTATAGEGCA